MSIRAEVCIVRPEAEEWDAEFAARVTACQNRVFRIACGVLRDPAAAEEVAQETFLQAYEKYGRLREPEKFRSWVNRIAFRLALNRQRGDRRRKARDAAWLGAAAEPVLDSTRAHEQRALLNRLWEEIDKLPETLRSVLVLSTIEGLQTAEVAGMLGIPAGTARSRLHTARKRLLKALE